MPFAQPLVDGLAQDEHLDRLVVRVDNPVLGNAGSGVFGHLVAAVGYLRMRGGHFHDQIGGTEHLLGDAIGMAVRYKKEIRLANLAGPQAHGKGGQADDPQVMSGHKGMERAVEGADDLLVAIVGCGVMIRVPSDSSMRRLVSGKAR
jgi:hypothetical protein